MSDGLYERTALATRAGIRRAARASLRRGPAGGTAALAAFARSTLRAFAFFAGIATRTAAGRRTARLIPTATPGNENECRARERESSNQRASRNGPKRDLH